MTHENGDNLPKLTRNQAFVFKTLQGGGAPLVKTMQHFFLQGYQRIEH